MTTLCSLAFCIAGIFLAITEKNGSNPRYGYNTASASTVLPYAQPKLPLDIQLDLEKKYTKTDTVYVLQEIVYVGKSKYKPRVKRARTLADPVAKKLASDNPVSSLDSAILNQVRGVREEQTSDTLGPPKGSIILVVDGEEVYKR